MKLVKEAQCSGARLAPACEIMGTGYRTYLRWTKDESELGDKRPGASRPDPKNKIDDFTRQRILTLCASEEYNSYPPAYIVADLADKKGLFIASESTFYRVLRAQGMQVHRGRSNPPSPRKVATTHHSTKPNELWSWDITWLPGPARGTWFYLYLILDIFSRKIVGHEVYTEESGELSSELIERTYYREKIGLNIRPLVLHSDNGSPMKSSTFLDKLYDLNIVPSKSRPRVSNDNAYSEAIFKTLKYRPGYPSKGFKTIEESQLWVGEFVTWYNTQHRHSALKYVTPIQRHTGEAITILEKRTEVIQAAKDKNPNRWTGKIQDLSLPEQVTLNPEKVA